MMALARSAQPSPSGGLLAWWLGELRECGEALRLVIGEAALAEADAAAAVTVGGLEASLFGSAA